MLRTRQNDAIDPRHIPTFDPKPSSGEQGHSGCCYAVPTKPDRMTSTSRQLGSGKPTGEAQMRRREFVAMLGSAAAVLPIAVRAQQSAKQRRIGVLMNREADSSEGQARITAIQQRLQQLGWSDGQNLLME